MWMSSEWWSARAVRVLVWFALAVLAGCGGGDQIEPFVPRQVIVLGDENAALMTNGLNGKNFGINGVDGNGALACANLPLWTQSLAASFGFVTDRCNPNNLAVGAVTRGAPGAKAADLAAQIAAQMSAGAASPKDLYVVMIGLSDIIERFEVGATCNGNNPDQRDRVLFDSGAAVAAQINRLVDANMPVIVSTMYDLGLSPYARTRGASDQLTCLTASFNAGLRVNIKNVGRIGLVLADDLVRLMTNSPGSYVFDGSALGNVSTPACAASAPAPDCNANANSLVPGASAGNFLWADDRHPGPSFHNQLSALAQTRARNNPF